MKKILLFVVGIILSINISAQCPLTTAVDFTATDCHGTEIHLFDLLDGGQHVLIDFFYTTCGPCQQATPKVAEAYSMLGCNDFEVFFIEITPSDNDAACQTWCNNYGIEYPTIGTNGGGGTICNTYQIGAYPTLVLIAPDRSIKIQDLWPINNAMTIVNALAPFGIQQHECGSAPTCVAPQNVAAVVNDDLSITVSWEDVAEAVSYTLYVDGEMTEEGITGTTVTSPANQIPGTYCATVVTVCAEGTSEPSTEVCVTIDEPKCDSPQNLIAVVNEDLSITVSWDVVAEAVSYTLYIDSEMIEAGITGTTVTSPANQMPGTYCATVVTVCDNNLLSDPSEEVCVTIDVAVAELESSISLFPNPADQYLKILCENMQQVDIYNMMGQHLFTKKTVENETIISTENLPTGTYILQVINSENKLESHRFVISR